MELLSKSNYYVGQYSSVINHVIGPKVNDRFKGRDNPDRKNAMLLQSSQRTDELMSGNCFE